jgi:hypothetical protein
VQPAALFFQLPSGPEALVDQWSLPEAPRRRGRLLLPFATTNHPINEMTIWQRLLWILMIGFGAAFSMGIYLAGLASLARLIQA